MTRLEQTRTPFPTLIPDLRGVEALRADLLKRHYIAVADDWGINAEYLRRTCDRHGIAIVRKWRKG